MIPNLQATGTMFINTSVLLLLLVKLTLAQDTITSKFSNRIVVFENEDAPASSGDSEDVVLLNLTAYEIEVVENSGGVQVNCTANTTTNNNVSDFFSVLWFDENDVLVSRDEKANEYQIGYEGNSSAGNAVLFISGNITNRRFSTYFTCKANTTDSTNEEILIVHFLVPLSLEEYFVPDYVCSNQPAILSCTFRGYPKPEVTWSGYSSYVTNNTFDDYEYVRTTLLVLNMSKTETFTCVAQSQSEELQQFLTVNVLDDELDEVFHYNIDGTTCLVSWNESDIAPLTRKILVRYEVDDQTTVMHSIKQINQTEDVLMMQPNDVVRSVSVALVRNECIGPFAISQGNCSYKNPLGAQGTSPPAALITVSVLFGITLFLVAVYAAFTWYRNRKDPCEEEEFEMRPRPSMPPFNGHMQLQGVTTTEEEIYESTEASEHSQPVAAVVLPGNELPSEYNTITEYVNDHERPRNGQENAAFAGAMITRNRNPGRGRNRNNLGEEQTSLEAHRPPLPLPEARNRITPRSGQMNHVEADNIHDENEIAETSPKRPEGSDSDLPTATRHKTAEPYYTEPPPIPDKPHLNRSAGAKTYENVSYTPPPFPKLLV